jgi:hypothetical protein
MHRALAVPPYPPSLETRPAACSPTLAVVDDAGAIIARPRMRRRGAATVLPPTVFQRALEADPGLFSRLSAVILDHSRREADRHPSCVHTASEGSASALVLSSEGTFSRAQIPAAIDLVIDEAPVPLNLLLGVATCPSN